MLICPSRSPRKSVRGSRTFFRIVFSCTRGSSCKRSPFVVEVMLLCPLEGIQECSAKGCTTPQERLSVRIAEQMGDVLYHQMADVIVPHVVESLWKCAVEPSGVRPTDLRTSCGCARTPRSCKSAT